MEQDEDAKGRKPQTEDTELGLALADSMTADEEDFNEANDSGGPSACLQEFAIDLVLGSWYSVWHYEAAFAWPVRFPCAVRAGGVLTQVRGTVGVLCMRLPLGPSLCMRLSLGRSLGLSFGQYSHS